MTALTLQAQTIRYSGGTYAEDFNLMGSSGTITPNGWYVGTAAAANLTAVTVGDGSAGPNSLIAGWNYGSAGSPERALGTAATAADRNVEARIVNDTGVDLTSFVISYDGEEWRTAASSSGDGYVLKWSTNGVNYTELGPQFNFTAPVQTGSAGPLNGNLTGNRRASLGGYYALPGAVPTGGTLYLRWHDTNGLGYTDGGIAIDNFTFTTDLAPISILTPPPAGVTVTQLTAVSWSLVVAGAAPAYQWYEQSNGVFHAVSGATNAVITLAHPQLSDSTNFYCRVAGLGNVVTSTITRLVVVPLTGSPAIWTAEMELDGTRTNFVVRWNRPMGVSAANRLNYALCRADDPLDCLSLQEEDLLVVDETNVFIRVSPGTPAAEGVAYVISAYGVADLAGNAVPDPDGVSLVFPIPNSWQQGMQDYAGCQDVELKSGTAAGGIYQGDIPQDPAGGVTGYTNILVDLSDGASGQPAGPSQALVRFDGLIGEDAGQIPPGANIVWARLRLTSSSDEAQSGGPVHAFLMLRDWSQSSATWEVPLLEGNNGFPAVQNDGGEAEVVPVTSFAAFPGRDPATYGPQTVLADVTAAVQAWAGGTPNHGVLLTNASTDGYRFDSSEATEVATRPQLFVVWDLTQPAVTLTNLVVLTNNAVLVPVTNLVVLDEGGSVSLTFGVGGYQPQFQWYRITGGETNVVAGETHPYLIRSPALRGDAGQYFLRAYNASSETNSEVIMLQIIPDTVSPSLQRAARTLSLTNIVLTYSEPVLGGGVAGNYTVCEAAVPGNCLAVVSAVMSNNNRQAILTTPLPTAGRQYRVTADNVTDVALNPLATNSALVAATVSFQQNDINGYAGTVDTHVRLDEPDNSFGSSSTVLVDINNPVSQGLLRFGEVFGSSPGRVPYGATIASATLRVRTVNAGDPVSVHRMLADWTENSTWNSLGDGVSTNNLEAVAIADATFTPAANNAFIDINVTASLQAWADGAVEYGWVFLNLLGDGWQFDSSESSNHWPQLVVAYLPASGPIQILSQPPAVQTVAEGELAVVTVKARGADPRYQWYVGGQPSGAALPGQTNNTLDFGRVIPAQAGAYYCVIQNDIPSSATTVDSVLSVVPDNTAPSILAVETATNRSVVIVAFSERMLASAASNAANYSITNQGGGAVGITGVVLTNNDSVAVLTLATPLAAGAAYTLSINAAVTDAAVAGNALVNPVQAVPVPVLLVAFGSDWRYQAGGVDLYGTGWWGAGYDDAAWSNAPALLVAKRGTPGAYDTNIFGPAFTALPMTNPPTATNVIFTYYFRTRFDLPTDPSGVGSLTVRAVVDDGAVFYLNGVEALAVDMPGPTNRPVYYTNFATATQGDNYLVRGPFSAYATNLSGLVSGENVLAVEVHQANAGSSDIAFAAEVWANFTSFPPPRPVMRASYDGTTVRISWTGAGKLLQADSVSGPWSEVAGATSPFSVAGPLAMKKFYRVQQ